jgi:hypothetical protein
VPAMMLGDYLYIYIYIYIIIFAEDACLQSNTTWGIGRAKPCKGQNAAQKLTALFMQMPRPAYAVFRQIQQCLNANTVVRRRCHLPDVEFVV